MKRSIVHYLFVPLLITCLVCMIIGGCKPAESTTPVSTTSQTTKEAEETSGTTATGTEEPKELVTLTAFIMQSVASTFGVEEDWFGQIMKDELNIQIEFMPTGDQVDQKLQALMAGGELPDIVGFKETKLAVAAVEANMLISLDANKDKLPNIFENNLLKHAVNYYRDQVSAGKNELYMMPSAVGPVGGVVDTNWKPQLLWRVYQDIGAPEINTLEDYLTVTKQMQEHYPENEAGEKVYGFELFADWDNLNALEVCTLSFFYGIDTEYVCQLMETDVVTHEMNSILDEDSFYKRALTFYYNANQMGLLDPDSLTQKFDTVQQKFTAGRVLFTPFSWLTGDFNARGSGHVDADPPNGYEFVPAKDMKIYDAPYQWVGRPWTFALGAASKYPDRALEFFNWFYDIDTTHLINNGPEGVLWVIENNEPKITDEGWNIIDNNLDMPLPGGGLLKDPGTKFNTMPYTGQMEHPDTGFAVSYRYWPSTLNRNPTKLKLEWREWSGYNSQVEMMKALGMIAPATQAINMVVPAPDDLQLKMNQIGDVIKTNSWKMVFAENETEFEALWTDMVTKANGLGIEEVNQYYMKAWEDALNMAAKYQD
ncbi:MAG: hypothetical protein KBG64_03520 [Clostridia bacterium]|nr:hypothetical protein [Clostridia bacterium]